MYSIFTYMYHILPLKTNQMQVNMPYMDGMKIWTFWYFTLQVILRYSKLHQIFKIDGVFSKWYGTCGMMVDFYWLIPGNWRGHISKRLQEITPQEVKRGNRPKITCPWTPRISSELFPIYFWKRIWRYWSFPCFVETSDIKMNTWHECIMICLFYECL